MTVSECCDITVGMADEQNLERVRRDVDNAASGTERTRAGLNLLLLLTVSWPLAVLWHGLPVLWQDYPAAVRRQWLTLVRGKTGPYKGVVW